MQHLSAPEVARTGDNSVTERQPGSGGTKSHALVIGDLDLARRTCNALAERGWVVTHLLKPTESEISAALKRRVDAVAVLINADVAALRYALLVEHFQPEVRLVATVFDRTLSEQVARAVPNCQVTSPADIAVPSIIGACLGDDVLAVDDAAPANGFMVRRHGPDGVSTSPYRRRRSRMTGVLEAVLAPIRPYDNASRILLIGLLGLVVVLLLDWLFLIVSLHQGVIRSFLRGNPCRDNGRPRQHRSANKRLVGHVF